MAYIPRLKEEYLNRIVKTLTDEFSYENVMQVPKLQKIVISKGVGAAVADKKLIEYAVDELTMISGQKGASKSLPLIRKNRLIYKKNFPK